MDSPLNLETSSHSEPCGPGREPLWPDRSSGRLWSSLPHPGAEAWAVPGRGRVGGLVSVFAELCLCVCVVGWGGSLQWSAFPWTAPWILPWACMRLAWTSQHFVLWQALVASGLAVTTTSGYCGRRRWRRRGRRWPTGWPHLAPGCTRFPFYSSLWNLWNLGAGKKRARVKLVKTKMSNITWHSLNDLFYTHKFTVRKKRI